MPGSLPCAAGEQTLVADALYFGMNVPSGGTVSPEDWARFLTEEVTPRFPQGFTAWDASGQWRGATGTIEREASHVLQLVHPDTVEADAAIAAIADRYKAAFQQEAVLRTRSAVCVSFR